MKNQNKTVSTLLIALIASVSISTASAAGGGRDGTIHIPAQPENLHDAAEMVELELESRGYPEVSCEVYTFNPHGSESTAWVAECNNGTSWSITYPGQ